MPTTASAATIADEIIMDGVRRRENEGGDEEGRSTIQQAVLGQQDATKHGQSNQHVP